MVERAHNHIKANCAVARKLATRVWATLTSGRPCQFRDLDGNPLDPQSAAALAVTFTVPESVRRRARAYSHAHKRGRLSG